MNTSAEVLLVAIPVWAVIWSFIKYVLKEHDKVAHRVRLRHISDNAEFTTLLQERNSGH
jgi:hypothetical protein